MASTKQLCIWLGTEDVLVCQMASFLITLCSNWKSLGSQVRVALVWLRHSGSLPLRKQINKSQQICLAFWSGNISMWLLVTIEIQKFFMWNILCSSRFVFLVRPDKFFMCTLIELCHNRKSVQLDDLALTLACPVWNFDFKVSMTRRQFFFFFSGLSFVPTIFCVGEALQQCCVCSPSPGSHGPW